jgi:hypothetical protein
MVALPSGGAFLVCVETKVVGAKRSSGLVTVTVKAEICGAFATVSLQCGKYFAVAERGFRRRIAASGN